jgi:hypothetical protein
MNKLLIFGAGLVVGCYMGEAYLKKKAKETADDLCCKSLDEDDWTEHDMNVTPCNSYNSYYCTESYKTKKVAEKELADLRLNVSEDILTYGSVSEADIKRYFDNEDAITPYDKFYGWVDTEDLINKSKVAKCKNGGYMIVLEFRNLKKEDK